MEAKHLTPVGYEAIVRALDLSVVPHYRASFTAKSWKHEAGVRDGREQHVYPAVYTPGNSLLEHAAFALKHDGVNLLIMKEMFKAINRKEVTKFVEELPLSKYSRMIWFLYEFLTGKELPLNDIETGNYVPLLDEKKYFTGSPLKVRRHRIVDNLLGDSSFCPVVRKTERLMASISKNLPVQLNDVLSRYDPSVVERAIQYLYTKETRTSFEIEREKPDAKRTMRFVEILKNAPFAGRVNKELLLKVQNAAIGDERFIAKDYRHTQNYVGEGAFGMRGTVHYISPLPADVNSLMDGLGKSSERCASTVDPVVHAAVVSFGFVFIHPFDDGNGRVHRYLIHHVLSDEGFTPKNVIFPVSSTMLSDMAAYDRYLEVFSKKVMPLIDFEVDERGEITVKGETADLYRYMDMTHTAEYLYETIESTMNKEFVRELDYLVGYRKASDAIKNVIDMPDKSISLLIRSVAENNCKLSKNKREKFFKMLSDDEISTIEEIIKEIFDPSKEQDNYLAPSL